MSIYSIYKATNTINGKVYIGFDSAWPSRQAQHLLDAERGSQKLFHKALRKYGSEAFTWDVICQSQNGEHLLNEMESYFIEEYNSFYLTGQGYNMTLGGEGSLGRKHSERTRKILSEKAKARPRTAEELKRFSEIGIGVKKTDDHKAKIRQALIGHEMLEKTKKKISASMTGKVRGPLDDQTKQKIRSVLKGRPSPLRGRAQSQELIEKRTHPQTQDAKEKIRAALKGKPKSEEAKQRMKEAWVRRKAQNQAQSEHINIR